jgi:hypothetical protein
MIDQEKDTLLLICEALAPEVEAFLPGNVEMRIVEFGLHLFPEKLNAHLRERLAEIDNEGCWQTVLLGFGLCSEGAVGLQSAHSRLVIPKTDDCIAILLGSVRAYDRELKNEPGTYYLTKGWIEHGEDPLSVFKRKHEWTKRYSDKKAQWVARELMKNYTRLAMIDTGSYNVENYMDYAREVADTFNLEFKLVDGSVDLLNRLVTGPWENDFLVLEPNEAITKEMFLRKRAD